MVWLTNSSTANGSRFPSGNISRISENHLPSRISLLVADHALVQRRVLQEQLARLLERGGGERRVAQHAEVADLELGAHRDAQPRIVREAQHVADDLAEIAGLDQADLRRADPRGLQRRCPRAPARCRSRGQPSGRGRTRSGCRREVCSLPCLEQVSGEAGPPRALRAGGKGCQHRRHQVNPQPRRSARGRRAPGAQSEDGKRLGFLQHQRSRRPTASEPRPA